LGKRSNEQNQSQDGKNQHCKQLKIMSREQG
jgi:hypothetical protein